MIAIMPMLNRNGVIAYVAQNAARYNLDPAAVLAVANHEGLNNGPGTKNGIKWQNAGESNWSFGPPSWYGNGAGSTILRMFGGNADQAAQWSWTPQGIDYWLQQVGQSAGGLTGRNAIVAIVGGFERPREDLRASEVSNAINDYNMFAGLTASAGGTAPTTTHPPSSNGGFDPGSGPVGQIPLNDGGTQLASFGGLPINIPSGLVLGMLAVLLLVLGVLLFAFNLEFHQQTVKVSPTGVTT